MFNPKDIEKEMLTFWDKENIYKKAVSKNKGKKKFYFVDGPPYTTGAIHIGHAWNKALKDCILRHKRMQGFETHDQPGFDMHGLPIEVEVEKKFEIKNKQEIIEKFGLKKFIEECERFAVEKMHPMIEDFKRMGCWFDWENPYMTIKNSYIEGAWLALKKSHDNGYLYKGEKAMTWCARCATALAKHELDYETIKEESVFIKFKIENKENEFLVLWTTTPWTLPFNMGVMVNPNLDYLKVKVDNEKWIVAKALAGPFINSLLNKKFEIVEDFKGEKLEGAKYIQPFKEDLEILNELSKNNKVHTVVLSEEYVDTTSGSGLVHMAPGCGPEDYEIGKRNNIPPFNELDEHGKYSEKMGKYKGLIAKKDDKKFIEVLKEKGALITTTEVEHEYAHCWRCKSPIVYRTTDQWFLAVSKIKDKMQKENKEVLWIPEWAGSRQFNTWLENLQDWCISRQRFWGIPLPIWYCKDCDNYQVIESKERLESLSKSKLNNLHRPFVDEIEIECTCGNKIKRIEDVLDVWMDSGAAPWASIEKNNLEVMDFILEGKDQIRGWFNSLMCLSFIAFGKKPYKAVYMHGMIMDAQGRKMSKSLKNTISPYEVIEEWGADTMRYYMCGGAKPGLDMNYNFEDVKVKMKNITILWNLHNYIIDLAEQNKFTEKTKPGKLSVAERYIISLSNNNIKGITELYKEYRLNEIPEVTEKIYLELSRTYIQSIREKIALGSDEEKRTIFYAIFTTYMNSLKLLAPIIPFTTEKIYQNLKQHFNLEKESIHLEDWPVEDKKLIDEKIIEGMEAAQRIIQVTLSEREKIGLGVRWPLKKLCIYEKAEIVSEFEEIIKTQTNVKKIVSIDDLGEWNKLKNQIETHGFKISLDTELTPELEKEGFSREITRLIQDLRKKAGLKKQDEIDTYIDIDYDIKEFKEQLKEKTGSKRLEFKKAPETAKYSVKKVIKGKNIEIFIFPLL